MFKGFQFRYRLIQLIVGIALLAAFAIVPWTGPRAILLMFGLTGLLAFVRAVIIPLRFTEAHVRRLIMHGSGLIAAIYYIGNYSAPGLR
jgi:hypothetical protein